MPELGDLFCRVYDALDDGVVAAEADRWLADDSLTTRSQSVMSLVLAGRPAASVAMIVDTDPTDVRRYAVLRGIDSALRYVNPAASTEDLPASLIGPAAYVAAKGRLDSGKFGGALLPRFTEPARPLGDPTHKRDLFSHVVRVAPATWEACNRVRLPEEALLLSHEVRAGLVVACVPVIADAAELRFDIRTTSARRYYRIAPKDLPATEQRIREIVANLDRSGALIAVAPELTLTPQLLDVWKRELRTRERRGSRLRWVIAGTGALNPGGRRPSNTAVLLDGRTGEELARQDKLFGFDFGSDQLAHWKLTGLLGSEAIAEDLARGDRLTVVDAGAVRVGILICEDVGRSLDVAPLVRDLGLSLLLTPVFSRPLKEHRWEHEAALTHLRETGATVVVSNSLVMSQISRVTGGTSLVLPRDGRALIGAAAGPAEPVCFEVKADGSARIC